MAKKKVHHRRRRRVSAPKRHTKRRRHMGAPLYASSVGKPRRRRRTATRKRGRRIGAGRGGGGGSRTQTVGSAMMEFLAIGIGGALGDVGASLGGNMLENAPMNLPPILIEGAKIVVGAGLYIAGGSGIGNNVMGNVVKGIGLGSAVSGARGAIKRSGIIPAMSGPGDRDMYVVIPNKMGFGNRVLYPKRMGAEKSIIGAEKSVIGGRNIRLYGGGNAAYEMMGV